MEFGREYEETETPDPPDDGYVEDIDTGPMTADTAEPETPETIANQMMEDVLARSGLERPDYGSVAQAPEPETPEPVIEPVAAAVEQAVEQNGQSSAKLEPVEIVMAGGARCAASRITSGIVYTRYDRITPEIVQENREYMERLRAEFRERGEPPSDHEQELIATAQEALLKYAETLGVDVADRMPPLEQYRLFDREDEFLATAISDRTVARAIPGIGVGIDRSSLPKDPVGRLHVIAHETAHTAHMVAVHSRMDEVGYKFTWAPCVVQDRQGKQRTGLYEAITDLHTHRALDSGGYYQRLGDRYPTSGHSWTDAILSGIITKYAAENGTEPNAIADEIVKGTLTGDLSPMERLVEPFSDRQYSIIIGLRVDERPRRLVEIAHALDLQDTQSIFDKWRNDELSRFRGAYNW